MTHPYLTSIDVDVTQLGKMATQKLMEQINQQVSSGIRVIVPHKLIRRETVLNLKKSKKMLRARSFRALSILFISLVQKR